MLTELVINNPSNRVWRVLKRGQLAGRLELLNLEADADIRHPHDFEVTDSTGQTNTFMAAVTQQGSQVKAWVEMGCEVDAHGNPTKLPPCDPRAGLTPTECFWARSDNRCFFFLTRDPSVDTLALRRKPV